MIVQSIGGCIDLMPSEAGGYAAVVHADVLRRGTGQTPDEAVADLLRLHRDAVATALVRASQAAYADGYAAGYAERGRP